jgi:hypothetical protein
MNHCGGVTRAGFLASVGAVIALPAGAATLVIPVVLEGGRFFATPRVASDGAVMKLWLDTDGSGFVFSESVARWALPTFTDRAKTRRRWTKLPEFAPNASIPAPLGREGRLAIFIRDDDDRKDPILAGFDGQLGASWFQGRVWTFDYRTPAVLLRDALTGDDGTRVPVRFETGSDGQRIDANQVPLLNVVVDGEPRTMSFDTAATVALNERARSRLADALPAVRATSFIRRAALDALRVAHPDWPAVDDVSVQPRMAALRVPSVRIGTVDLGPVWFTTRPDDDVFDGEPKLVGKLGANAFVNRVVSVDYPRAVLAIR